MLTSRVAKRRDRVGGARRPTPTATERVLETNDATLLDVVDNALTKGVVLSGELTLALAGVDLVYARLSLLLCAADRVLPPQRAKTARRHPIARGAMGTPGWGPRLPGPGAAGRRRRR